MPKYQRTGQFGEKLLIYLDLLLPNCLPTTNIPTPNTLKITILNLCLVHEVTES